MRLKNKVVVSNKVVNDISIRTIHSLDWNFEKYLEIFYLPENAKKETIKWFLKHTKDIGEKNNEIKILSPGVGNGRNELMLIESLGSRFRNIIIECDFIDYSQKSCKILIKKLKESGYKYKDSSYTNENIKINVIINDYSIWLEKKSDNKIKKYDIILTFFIINFLPDWRNGLIKTALLLKPNGILFVSQDIKDLCYLDNYFGEKPEDDSKCEFFNFWRDYYEIRLKSGLDWNSLISPANMNLIETIFKDIHKLTGLEYKKISDSEVDNSIQISWRLSDLENNISKKTYSEIKKLSFWYELIEGKSKNQSSEEEVFNCLFINPEKAADGTIIDLRKTISEELKLRWEPATNVGNLNLGQKLFFLKRSEYYTDENYANILRYSVYSNNFSASSVADFKFINRKDVEIDKVSNMNSYKLEYHLLNRLQDIYNTLIHNKDKCMLSLFSREFKLENNGFVDKSWRNKLTPKMIPVSFSSEQKAHFIKYYALYFAISKYLEKCKHVKRLMTSLIHTELSRRVGLIFTITNEQENVKPVYYHNSIELKYIQINLNTSKRDNLFKEFNKLKKLNDINIDKLVPISNYFYIEKTNEARDKIFEKFKIKYKKNGDMQENSVIEKILSKIIKITNDDKENLSEKIYNILELDFLNLYKNIENELKSIFFKMEDIKDFSTNNSDISNFFACNYEHKDFLQNIINNILEVYKTDKLFLTNPDKMSVLNEIFEIQIQKELQHIKERFNYIYLVTLSHYVDANVFIYTATNSAFIDGKEEDYYGLIIADNIPFISDNRFIESYYDQLVANTFTYSGMDGIIENDKINKLINLTKNRFATKSAISQVMARNMSHNIGSHVLAKMVKNEYLHEDFGKVGKQYIFINDLNPNLNKDDNTIIWFNSYLRNRMDYLADVSTGTPVMEVTRNLYSDIIAQFDRNRILLNRISGVDSFKFSLELIDERNKAKNNYKNNDIPVSIPNDALGFQAFYIIMENIIRNTAKHNSKSGKGVSNKRVFYLSVANSIDDKSMYEVTIYDNIKKKNINDLVLTQNKKLNESILDPITNGLRHGAWGLIEMEVSAAYLRKITPENIEEDKYEIDLENDNNRCNINFTTPNILKAVNVRGCLGYRFHLMKPKELVIFDETGELYKKLKKEKKIDLLSDNGILINHNCDNEDSNYKFNYEKIYTHPFLLVISETEEKWKSLFSCAKNNKYSNIKYNLPTRIILYKENSNEMKGNKCFAYCNSYTDLGLINAIINCDVDKEDKFNNTSTIMDLVWRIWLKNKISLNGLSEDYQSPFLHYVTNNKSDKNFEQAGKSVYKILLDYHAEGINDAFNNNHTCNYKYYEEYPSTAISTVDKTNPVYRLNINRTDKKNALFNTHELYKITDSIFTKIMIVDERIQYEYSKIHKYCLEKELTIKEIMKAAGVYVPNIDLNNTSYESNYKEKLIEEIKQLNPPLDFIVIHLGVIERILKASNKDKNICDVLNFVNDIESIYGNNNKLKVIITSGRGQPDNLPKELSFLPFSILSQYSIEIRFKSYLNQAIQLARPLSNF